MKAGELLAPNCFTDVLQKQRARDSRHYKHQINEFITTTGNENDKERYKSLSLCTSHTPRFVFMHLLHVLDDNLFRVLSVA